MSKMQVEPAWASALAVGSPVGVDRENKVLRGYVVAQRGYFKSKGRGQFDDQSLSKIVELMNAKPGGVGLKSRFAHPTMSDDGLGTFLGRSKNARLDGDRVRADLHLDPASFNSPRGNLGQYVLDLAASDPEALSSSLVLQTERVQVLGEDGKPKTDDKGQPIPPIWRPTKLHASDIVDTGDAVDGLLSADASGVDVDGLPLGVLWRGCEMLDRLFPGESRDVIEARCRAWLDRYLGMRFGDGVDPERVALEKMKELNRLHRKQAIANLLSLPGES